MRIDVKKFLFIGAEQDKALFFQKAQEAGIVDFIAKSSEKVALPAELNDFEAAIKILRGLPLPQQEELEDFHLAHALTLKIKSLNEKIHRLEEETRLNHLEITRIQIFGDFSLDDIHFIQNQSKRVIQFFFGKEGMADQEDLPEELIYVGTDFGLDYFIAINQEPVQYKKMGEMKITHSLSSLKERQKTIDQEIHFFHDELKAYAKYHHYLHEAFANYLNQFNLKQAQTLPSIPLKDLFAIEGWVPINKLDQLDHLVQELNVHMTEVAIDPYDIIPTFLENKGAARIGEDLVHIYDTPSSTDKDPSLWVLAWFTFFFSMIIGDAGYGLVFLATALYVKFKYKKFNQLGSRIWKLVTTLSVACVIWGLFMTSFFGVNISMDNPVRQVSLIHWLIEKKADYHFIRKDETYQEWVKKDPELSKAQNAKQFLYGFQEIEKDGAVTYPIYNRFYDNLLMELALLIGVIHIIVSFLRYLDRNKSGIGWIAFMIGAYLYIPTYLGATSIPNILFNFHPSQVRFFGIELMIFGLATALILSVIKNRLSGVLEAMNLIQIFADILSYLRLYALALAGAMVASTVNEFSSNVTFLVGAIIFIAGHLINMGLAIMSGVIHGLRLNFLEWYHYSFEGGGRRFNPLRIFKFE